MIIYNVTLSIHPEIETKVISWLKEVHIPEVMETGLFQSYHIYKVLDNHIDRNHNSYAVQYHLSEWAHFDEYNRHHSDRLREKTAKEFGENVLAFRTFLERV